MTMIRAIGWELNTIEECDGTFSGTGGQFTFSSSRKRSGTYSLKIQCNTTAGPYSGAYVSFISSTEIYYQFALWPDAFDYGTGYLQRIYSGDTILARLDINTVGQLLLYIGNGSTLVGTSAGALTNTGWNLIELNVKPAASGKLGLRLNGNIEIAYTGDTRVSDLTTADRITLCNPRYSGTSVFHYFDDIVVNDTNVVDADNPNNSWPSGLGLAYLKPVGVGTYSQWTSNPAGTTNYLAVDEVPPSASDYVTSTDNNQMDSYVIENSPTDAYSIAAVIPTYWLQFSGEADSAYLRSLLRISGTNYLGTTINVPTTMLQVSEFIEINPSTGVSFTSAELDELEFGMVVVS